jgi:hypothetical protein
MNPESYFRGRSGSYFQVIPDPNLTQKWGKVSTGTTVIDKFFIVHIMTLARLLKHFKVFWWNTSVHFIKYELVHFLV